MLYIYSGCPFVLHTKAQMCHLGQRSSLTHLSQISLISEKNNTCKEVQKKNRCISRRIGLLSFKESFKFYHVTISVVSPHESPSFIFNPSLKNSIQHQCYRDRYEKLMITPLNGSYKSFTRGKKTGTVKLQFYKIYRTLADSDTDCKRKIFSRAHHSFL